MVLWVHMSIFFAHLLAGVQEVRTKLALAKAARSWGVNPGSRSTLVDWAYLGDHWGSSGVDAFLRSLLWEVTVIWRRSHHAHMMCHCLIVMIVSHNLLRVKACENSIPVFTPKLRPLVLCSSLQRSHVYWPIPKTATIGAGVPMFLKMCMAECDRSPFWEGSKLKRQDLIKLVLCRSTGLEPSVFSCWLNSTFCWLNFHCMIETYRNPILDGKQSQYHSDWQKWLTFANFQSLPALSIFTNLVFHGFPLVGFHP